MRALTSACCLRGGGGGGATGFDAAAKGHVGSSVIDTFRPRPCWDGDVRPVFAVQPGAGTVTVVVMAGVFVDAEVGVGGNGNASSRTCTEPP